MPHNDSRDMIEHIKELSDRANAAILGLQVALNGLELLARQMTQDIHYSEQREAYHKQKQAKKGHQLRQEPNSHE